LRKVSCWPANEASGRSSAVADDLTGVGVLAAGLGIERGLLQDHLDLVARLGGVHQHPVAHDAPDPAVRGQLGIAEEAGLAGVAELAVGLGDDRAALLGLRVGLGALPLLVHQHGEPGVVDRQSLLLGHLQGQLDREAVRVVQLERLRALELVRAAGLGLAHGDVEDARPGRQSPAERLLLGVRDLADPAEVGLQLGVGLLHLLQADRQ